MGARTLYQQLSVPGRALGCGRYRTEYTANDRETIDDDRLIIDLYAELGDLVVSDGSEVGRTEITRIAAPETVDRDHADQFLDSSLTGPPTDLYGVLACSGSSSADDRGETTRTLTTDETIDEGWAPDLPYT
jgi:hypothetical protein